MLSNATCYSSASASHPDLSRLRAFALFIDSHCHLDFPDLLKQLPDVLARMKARQVTHAMCIGVSLPGFPAVLALAQAHANLYASVGVHPEQADALEPNVETLCRLANHPKVIAIGETGLDYHWHKETGAGELEWQRNRFRTHIRAARACRKPLVIHTRNAAPDTIRLMQEEGAGTGDGGPGGVMHCFTEDWSTAKAALDLGFYISFSGIVTFKNANAIRDVARQVPLDRILIETDSPYLAPAPHRGKTNEPSFVAFVAEEIARIKDLEATAVGRYTTENFFRLFNVINEDAH